MKSSHGTGELIALQAVMDGYEDIISYTNKISVACKGCMTMNLQWNDMLSEWYVSTIDNVAFDPQTGSSHYIPMMVTPRNKVTFDHNL